VWRAVAAQQLRQGDALAVSLILSRFNGCEQLDDPASIDGTTQSAPHIDFGDDGAPIASKFEPFLRFLCSQNLFFFFSATLFFPVIRPTVTVALMSLLAGALCSMCLLPEPPILAS
jgi:hypothetical protein